MPLALAVASLSLPLLSAGGQAWAGQKVTMGQVTANTVAHAPIEFARALGFFEEEGIDLQIVEFDGAAMLIPQIAAKRVTIGYPNPDILVIARQPGRSPLPLKFFYNMARASIWEVVVKHDSPILALQDLDGKRIGTGALTWGNIPLMKAMFKDLGMDYGKNPQVLPVGVGAPAFRALVTGQIDALNLFDVQHAKLEQTGVKIRRLPFPQTYEMLMSNGFIAHEDTIRDQAPLLIGFGRAVTKGIIACATNPQGCVKAYWQTYPNQKPTQGTEEEKLANDIKVMQARLQKVMAFEEGRPHRYGAYDERVWTNFVKALYDGGQISTPNIPVQSLYTNDFVGEFNRFNTQAVIQAAKDFP